jgi:hypothetical protein
MNDMLLGMISMGCLVAALFFLRFWKSTRDRFFLFFAGAFGIEAFSRAGLALTHPVFEDFPGFFLLRLASFGLILMAILDKNRSR